MEWPIDVMVQLLQALSVECDTNAQRAWHQLAFITCKRDELAQAARSMAVPILLRIAFDPKDWNGSLTFKVPFMQATVVCVDVDWGDGYVEELREKGDGSAKHTYAAPGEYSVRIFPAANVEDGPSLDHLGFSEHTLKGDTFAWWFPLKEIVSLGTCGLRSLGYLFACSHCNVDLRNLRTGGISDMSGMFERSSFNQPIGKWDVRNVTLMPNMFFLAKQFDQPIGNWNVSNVTNMTNMFNGAKVFDQPIGNWDVSNVVSMCGMFTAASSFNQPIGDWDVSNVTNMHSLFAHASNFNQSIATWNVSRVTDMSCMFWEAYAFNQPIGDWNASGVDMRSMFRQAGRFN
jgi:surface protein